MVCIFCGRKLEVINSRSQRKLNQVWRRRHCSACDALFTTAEAIDLSKALRIRHSKAHLEPFQRVVLLISIYEACKHRETATQDASALTDTVISKVLRKKYGTVITRNQLCGLTTEVLRRFDKATATSYAAYHPLTQK